jgi:hypothetical protein
MEKKNTPGNFDVFRIDKGTYYHCMGYRCKGRFGAEVLTDRYEEKLKKIHLRPEVYELFGLVLEDENVFSCQWDYY